ncbi:MAG: GPP34 family phosphoprotein, partial [Clostridiales bacterium]|nr:GPP34 family phosphoprotein [Clostridiales bacterium]
NKFLRIENRKFLGLIPYRKSYLIDGTTRENLISQLRNNVLFRHDLNEDSILMLGLIEACKMHKIITSDREELKKLKKELKEIIKESPIADTVDKTIKQVQAAIIGAIVASTVVASSSGSN